MWDFFSFFFLVLTCKRLHDQTSFSLSPPCFTVWTYITLTYHIYFQLVWLFLGRPYQPHCSGLGVGRRGFGQFGSWIFSIAIDLAPLCLFSANHHTPPQPYSSELFVRQRSTQEECLNSNHFPNPYLLPRTRHLLGPVQWKCGTSYLRMTKDFKTGTTQH